MTTVLDATEREGDDTPFERLYGDHYIEIPEEQLRTVSRPQIGLARLKSRLDEVGMKLAFGRGR